MASRKEIAADIRAEIGNFPSFGDVTRYLGMNPKTAREWLEGVPYHKLTADSRQKHYLAIDLARRIEELEAI